jgi:hypothetical protein
VIQGVRTVATKMSGLEFLRCFGSPAGGDVFCRLENGASKTQDVVKAFWPSRALGRRRSTPVH